MCEKLCRENKPHKKSGRQETEKLKMKLLILLNYFFFISCFNSKDCSSDPASEGGWSIGIVTGTNLYNLLLPKDSFNQTLKCQRNPIITCLEVNDVEASFVADPFLYVEDNNANNPWYLFFEVKNLNQTLVRRHGQIGAAVSNDQGVSWKYLQIVVVAKWHLSYPFVFKYKGNIYMMPQGNSISYWKAINFPLEWEYHSTVHNRNLNDATMIEYDSKWWLFSIHEPNFNKKNWLLHILYSSSPFGPWIDTPNNCYLRQRQPGNFICTNQSLIIPHKTGSVGVRPGGHMFIDERTKKLYRVVQNTASLYGDSLDLYEITSLTIDKPLEEKLIPEFQANIRKESNIEEWNKMRFHHLDLHLLKFSENRYEWVGMMDGDYLPGYLVRNSENMEYVRCSDLKNNNNLKSKTINNKLRRRTV